MVTIPDNFIQLSEFEWGKIIGLREAVTFPGFPLPRYFEFGTTEARRQLSRRGTAAVRRTTD